MWKVDVLNTTVAHGCTSTTNGEHFKDNKEWTVTIGGGRHFYLVS